MGERRHGVRVAVLSRSWGRTGSEAAFVARGVAGALSRHAEVTVLVPGAPDHPVADGAFDLLALGPAAADGTWPDPGGATWPAIAEPDLVVTDDPVPDGPALAATFGGVPVVALTAGAEAHPGVGAWGVGPGDGSAASVGSGPAAGSTRWIGMHVPVSSLAAARRHNGLGETGYVLVLTDRGPLAPAAGGAGGAGGAAGADGVAPAPEPSGRRPVPPGLAAWLVARFPAETVVVVEDARATVWRSRCLRGDLGVDTRTDLWRLVAHAGMVVDLGPGALLARECVEALRYQVPVVVPAGTVAARLAATGGGLWYRDVPGLLGCVEALGDPGVRRALGAQGRAAADERYGHPGRFVDRVGDALRAAAGTGRAAAAAGSSGG